MPTATWNTNLSLGGAFASTGNVAAGGQLSVNGGYIVRGGASYLIFETNQGEVFEGHFTDGMAFKTNSQVARFLSESNNVWSQRNSTTGQTQRIYNTFTDASNYQRASLQWSSNVFYLRNEAAGSGSPAPLMVPVTGTTTVSGLPAASTAGAGARAMVTDANSTTFLATAAGGGANIVPVVSNGTNWVIG